MRNQSDKNILEVRCSVCLSFFIPSLNSVRNRLAAIRGIQGGEHKFYCSETCKNECSVYGRSLYQKDHPKRINSYYTQSEFQTFREFVLERDNYQCQYCHEQATDVHHERPKKLEPFFALDPDLAWSCCESCHYEKGHPAGTECSTGNLSSNSCWRS